MDVGIPTDNCNACGGKQWPHEHGQQVVDAKDCQGMPKDYPADKQGNPTATPGFILRKCMGLHGPDITVGIDTPITKLCSTCLMLTGGNFPQTYTSTTMARLRDVKDGKFSGYCSCK